MFRVYDNNNAMQPAHLKHPTQVSTVVHLNNNTSNASIKRDVDKTANQSAGRIISALSASDMLQKQLGRK